MVNKVILIGNTGREPDVRYLDSGVAYARFPLATNETYKNKEGERVTNTEWHNIVVWRGTAEFAEKYIKKGMRLYVEGRLRTSSYEKDGVTRYNTEILGSNVQILEKRDDRMPEPQDPMDVGVEKKNTTQKNNDTTSTFDETPDEPDDLPF